MNARGFLRPVSREQARGFLALYHFTPTDIMGTMERLATVQYDPLNPVGRNPDLVFQARIPGYQVDDWQKAAYTDRLVYDAWDKQACLVPISDWPMRAFVREKYRPYHDREILQAEADLAASVLAAIDDRGPLSSLEFEDRQRVGGISHGMDRHAPSASCALSGRADCWSRTIAREDAIIMSDLSESSLSNI